MLSNRTHEGARAEARQLKTGPAHDELVADEALHQETGEPRSRKAWNSAKDKKKIHPKANACGSRAAYSMDDFNIGYS